VSLQTDMAGTQGIVVRISCQAEHHRRGNLRCAATMQLCANVTKAEERHRDITSVKEVPRPKK
jgi:hypothetical protein